MRYIYIIGAVELSAVKVGVASNPKSRLGALQTGNPFRLSILDTFEGTGESEKKLHAKLKAYRMSGEWFDIPSDDPVGFIRKIANEPVDPDEEVWLGKWEGWDYYVERRFIEEDSLSSTP